MTELELAARRSIDWVKDVYPASDTPEEGHLALLVQLALPGFYYYQALEDNDQLRLTGDPQDLADAVAHDLAAMGVGIYANSFLSFKGRYPDWQSKLREIIDRLEALRSKETVN